MFSFVALSFECVRWPRPGSSASIIALSNRLKGVDAQSGFHREQWPRAFQDSAEKSVHPAPSSQKRHHLSFEQVCEIMCLILYIAFRSQSHPKVSK